MTVPPRSSLDENIPGKHREPFFIAILLLSISLRHCLLFRFLVSFIEPIQFTSDKVLEAMENLNAEEMREKVARALALSRQRADKRKEAAQGEAAGTPPPKAKNAAPGRGQKRATAEARAVGGSSPKQIRASVDMDMLRNSPSGKMVLSGSAGNPDTIVEITQRRDREADDRTFLGWNPDFRRR